MENNATNNARFHRDPRVIAARKQYRSDIKTMPEKEAWKRLNAVVIAVRNEIYRSSAYPPTEVKNNDLLYLGYGQYWKTK